MPPSQVRVPSTLQIEGGIAWVAFYETNGGVGKYDGNAWVSIAPLPDRKGSMDIMVKPGNPEVVWVFTLGAQEILRTTNGGRSWIQMNQAWMFKPAPQQPYVHPAWMAIDPTTTGPWMCTGDIKMDPRVPGRVWWTEGNGVYRSTNWSDTTTKPDIIHHSRWSRGIEELCPVDVEATIGGKFIYGAMDMAGFVTNNPDSVPTPADRIDLFEGYKLTMVSDVAVHPTNRALIAATSGCDYAPMNDHRSSGYSTDGGQTWRKFTSQIGIHGDIALSLNTPGRMVWAPAYQNKIYYTDNWGASWRESSIDATFETPSSWPAQGQNGLATDYVNGKIYAYSPTGRIFVSTNDGASFTTVKSNFLGAIWSGQLKAVPGKANHVLLSTGLGWGHRMNSDQGLYLSQDGGANWNKVPGITVSFAVGFGKEAPGSSNPTIYVCGARGGSWVEPKLRGEEWGVFMSTDLTATWTKISGWPAGYLKAAVCISGDMENYGRVAMGISGNGFVYGEYVDDVRVAHEMKVSSRRGSTMKITIGKKVLHVSVASLPASGVKAELRDVRGRMVAAGRAGILPDGRGYVHFGHVRNIAGGNYILMTENPAGIANAAMVRID